VTGSATFAACCRDERAMTRPVLIAAALLLMGSAAAAQSAGTHWVATWGNRTAALSQPASRRTRRECARGGRPAISARRASAGCTTEPGAPWRSASRERVRRSRASIPDSARPAHSQQPDGADDRAQRALAAARCASGLSQALGATSVVLGSAHIAIRSRESEIVAATDRVLTFSGKPGAILYAGAVLVSDPVSLDVPPLADVAVSLYFPGGHRRPDQSPVRAASDLYFWTRGCHRSGRHS